MSALRAPAGPWTRAAWTDVLVVVLAAGSALEIVVRRDAPPSAGVPMPVVAAALAVLALPLLARRRYPFAAPVGVWVLAAALSFVDGRAVVVPFGSYLAGVLSALLLGHLRDPGRARAGLVVVIGAAATVVANDPDATPVSLVFLPAFFALAWLAGLTARSHVEQAEAAERRAVVAERERESAARVAVAEERARIARELHDVVAHSVSVMVLRVGAVRLRVPAGQDAVREALQDVEHVGREALTEMRRLLGGLSGDDGPDGAADAGRGPQPGLDDLDPLVERVRRAGLEVDVRVEGERGPVPRAVDLSAYRIVQEGLTNVLKHAAARRAAVTVRYAAGALLLEVRDDGVGPRAGDGYGRGLVGIGERVKIYGGAMSAGAAPEGGYLLAARLPFDGAYDGALDGAGA